MANITMKIREIAAATSNLDVNFGVLHVPVATGASPVSLRLD
jgi:hypothetical protein